MDNHMKKEDVSNFDPYEAVAASVNLATTLLRLNETSRVNLQEMLRLVESLKIEIQGKLASRAN